MSSFFFERLKIMCRSIPAILKNRRRPSELCRTKISESTGFSYQLMLGIKNPPMVVFFNSTIGGISFLLSIFMDMFTTTSFFYTILPFVFDRISDYVSNYKTFFRYCPVYE